MNADFDDNFDIDLSDDALSADISDAVMDCVGDFAAEMVGDTVMGIAEVTGLDAGEVVDGICTGAEIADGLDAFVQNFGDIAETATAGAIVGGAAGLAEIAGIDPVDAIDTMGAIAETVEECSNFVEDVGDAIHNLGDMVENCVEDAVVGAVAGGVAEFAAGFMGLDGSDLHGALGANGEVAHLQGADVEPVCSITIGDPQSQAEYWQQQSLPDDCAVMAQVSLLQQFGVDITEDQAVYECASMGWYGPGGTKPEDVGNLMELHGVSTHDVQNATIADLAYEIQQGHGVIVGVKAEELWANGPLAEFQQWLSEACGLDNSTFNPANHAVSLIGFDLSDPSNPLVFVNDPGTPDGCAHPYPLEKFMDAWANSDFYYTATDAAIPHDEATYGNMDLLDMSKWLDGGMAAGPTLEGMENFSTGTDSGLVAGEIFDDLFSDDSYIRNI